MKKGLKLTALLLAMLLLFQSAAFATEQTGGISLYSLDDESYALMKTGAVELAAVSDEVMGIAVVNADAVQLCSNHYRPGDYFFIHSEVLDTLKKGTVLTVYQGKYDGIISGSWLRVEYNGQKGYIQEIYLTVHAAETDEQKIVELAEWVSSGEVEVTEAMLARAMKASSLDSMMLEGTQLIHVRTGEAFATYDPETGLLTDNELGVVFARVDLEKKVIIPIGETEE